MEETFLLTRYCFSLINLGTYALRLCLVCVVDVRVRPRSSVGILEEALDLTVDLCTALFLHNQVDPGVTPRVGLVRDDNFDRATGSTFPIDLCTLSGCNNELREDWTEPKSSI